MTATVADAIRTLDRVQRPLGLMERNRKSIEMFQTPSIVRLMERRTPMLDGRAFADRPGPGAVAKDINDLQPTISRLARPDFGPKVSGMLAAHTFEPSISRMVRGVDVSSGFAGMIRDLDLPRFDGGMVRALDTRAYAGMVNRDASKIMERYWWDLPRFTRIAAAYRPFAASGLFEQAQRLQPLARAAMADVQAMPARAVEPVIETAARGSDKTLGVLHAVVTEVRTLRTEVGTLRAEAQEQRRRDMQWLWLMLVVGVFGFDEVRDALEALRDTLSHTLWLDWPR